MLLMRLNSAALALAAAAAVSQHGVGGLVIVTKTIIETATAPLGGACQTPLTSQRSPNPSIDTDLATNLQPTKEMVIAPSTSTTWTTTTTTVVVSIFTTKVTTGTARSAVMSLNCGCKINKKNGFIDCSWGDGMLFGSGGVPECTMNNTATRPEHGPHTDAPAYSNTMDAMQTARGSGVVKPTKQRRSALEAGDNSAGFIYQCSYQPHTPFTINNTPVDASAPVYDFQFNPTLLGKPGPFSINDNGQLFDATGRMGTFDAYNKIRLRSPEAFTYPSPVTWSACGAGNTLLFGTTDQFYQCGNASFPAVWNTIPPGCTEASAQEGYSTTSCVKFKLVCSQSLEAELKKRQDGSYTGESTWPVTCGLFPGCHPGPTPLARRDLHDGVLGDGGRHVAYDSTTATLALAAEAVTEPPDENGAAASTYTIAAKTMVLKDGPAYGTGPAAKQKRQHEGASESPVIFTLTEKTARSLMAPTFVAPTSTSNTDLHDRPLGPTGIAARRKSSAPAILTSTITGTTAVETITFQATGSTETFTHTQLNISDVVTTITSGPIFSTETWIVSGRTTTIEITATDNDAKTNWFYQAVRDPGRTVVLVKYLATEPATYFAPLYQGNAGLPTSWTTIAAVASRWSLLTYPSEVPGYVLSNLDRLGEAPAAASTCSSSSTSRLPAPKDAAPTSSSASSSSPSSLSSSTASSPTGSTTGLSNREAQYIPDPAGRNPDPAVPTLAQTREARQNPNPCQMEHGCGTAYTTFTQTVPAVYTIIGEATISYPATTTTSVWYSTPKPGDGPPSDVQVKRNILEPHATYTTDPPLGLFASQPTATSSAIPYTGDSSKVSDIDGSKQLIAATIGMATFAVLAFLL